MPHPSRSPLFYRPNTLWQRARTFTGSSLCRFPVTNIFMFCIQMHIDSCFNAIWTSQGDGLASHSAHYCH
jgi:hypothetical protein